MPDLIPHMQQFDGPWAIYGPSADRFKALLQSMDWSAHFARQHQSGEGDDDRYYSGAGYEIVNGTVAEVRLEGVLSKYGSSLSRAGSTVRFREVLRSVRSAFDDGRVSACMIHIESGGGTTMGTPEAAQAVKSLAEHMPVHCYFEDIGASAAYWIGSQADKVACNASAIVGSIGTYMAIDDVSKMFDSKGIKTHLFTTGEHKGAGTVGTELTGAQQSEIQSLTERINAPFKAAVAQARGFNDEQVKLVSDGRVWRGEEAVSVGLVDAVMSYEEALAELAGETQSPAKGAKPMARSKKSDVIKQKSQDTTSAEETEEEEDDVEETESEDTTEEETESTGDEGGEEESKSKAPAKSTGKPATIAQLKAEFPKASSDFILESVESGLTLADARTAYLSQRVSTLEEENKSLKQQVGKPGAKPLGAGKSAATFEGDAKSAWKAAIDEKVKGGMSRARAVSAVSKEQPELHRAFIEASNAK